MNVGVIIVIVKVSVLKYWPDNISELQRGASENSKIYIIALITK